MDPELHMGMRLATLDVSGDASFKDSLRGKLILGMMRTPPKDASWQGWAPATTLRGMIAPLKFPQVTHRGQRRLMYVVLLAAILLLAAFHEPVLAALQRFAGYVPGVGFVDLEHARLLSAPARVTREGITVQIDQAVALPDRTIIVLHTTGLPEGTVGPTSETTTPYSLWTDEGYNVSIYIAEVDYGAAHLEFGRLADSVHRLVLKLKHIPGVPSGMFPQDWEIPFEFEDASSPTTQALPVPYSPEAAEVTRYGVTLRILEVAQGPSETALKWQASWEDPAWIPLGFSGGAMPALIDSTGRRYELLRGAQSSTRSTGVYAVPAVGDRPAGTRYTYEETLGFAPAPPGTSPLTFHADGLEFAQPADSGFTIDLGDHPQVGDRIPQDVRFTVVGFELHLTSASIVDMAPGIMIDLTADPVDDEGQLSLRAVMLEASSPLESCRYGWDGTQVSLCLSLEDGMRIPSGISKIRATEAFVLIRGPWDVTWTSPRE
ncbi:MAG: hypothetical protein IMZ46_17825 [Acidobacteria bacterium]|nr:hypothetical protein [Acidobacteriota bacterium]